MGASLPKFANRQRRQVETRWREMLPALTHFARQYQSASMALESFRRIYLGRIRTLLDAGVRWPSIRDGRLDWPLTSERGFQEHLRLFLERSARYGSHPRVHRSPHAYGQDFEKRYASDQERK